MSFSYKQYYNGIYCVEYSWLKGTFTVTKDSEPFIVLELSDRIFADKCLEYYGILSPYAVVENSSKYGKVKKVQRIDKLYMTPQQYLKDTGEEFSTLGSKHVINDHYICRYITEYKHVVQLNDTFLCNIDSYTLTKTGIKYVDLAAITILS
jgi:hypothetical protein